MPFVFSAAMSKGQIFGAGEAPQHLRHGHAGGLAEEIPERDVEGGIAAHLGPGGAKAENARQVARKRVDLERVPADDAGRHDLVDIGFDGSRMKEGFAEARQALVGMDEQPEEVRSLGDADGFQPGDLHSCLPKSGRGIAPNREIP